jgi:hypothetical protein
VSKNRGAAPLNDTTQFSNFRDYLPFEDDLALDLYNFEFPIPKDLID